MKTTLINLAVLLLAAYAFAGQRPNIPTTKQAFKVQCRECMAVQTNRPVAVRCCGSNNTGPLPVRNYTLEFKCRECGQKFGVQRDVVMPPMSVLGAEPVACAEPSQRGKKGVRSPKDK